MTALKSTSHLDNLTSQEKELFFSIMKQTQESGSLELLDSLWLVDYDEIPVSIDEFISNPHYLGNAFNNGSNIYPFWTVIR